jgi:hypothetical protein
VHFVGVVDPAGPIDRLVVMGALDHLLILGSAAVIVKDDPIRGHDASCIGPTSWRALI